MEAGYISKIDRCHLTAETARWRDSWNIQEEEEEEFVTKRNRPFSKSSRPTLLTGFDDDHEDDNEDEEDDDAHEDEEEDEDDDEDVEESREGFYNPREFEGLQVGLCQNISIHWSLRDYKLCSVKRFLHFLWTFWNFVNFKIYFATFAKKFYLKLQKDHFCLVSLHQY
jgi:hypothetical protein